MFNIPYVKAGKYKMHFRKIPIKRLKNGERVLDT